MNHEDYANATVAAAAPGLDTSGAAYLLGLADDALVYTQRLGEWISRAPQIEEDMALGNIGLDLLGQARALYPRVGELDGTGRGEDDYAYFRDEREFRNVHLVEQEPLSSEAARDFGFEMARMLWFASYQRELYAGLGAPPAGTLDPASGGVTSRDETLAAVAAKALKEVDYHRDHATHWVLRLGDGTAESHERMQDALERVAPYVPELFDDDPTSVAAAEAGIGVLPSSLQPAVTAYVTDVVQRATLSVPEPGRWRASGGRTGVHSRAMGYLVAEMQHLARSHPGVQW